MKTVADINPVVLGEMSDEALIRTALTRNERAWRELVRRYHGKVSATVRRIYGPRPETEDIVQEIFIELAKSAKNFRHDSSLSTFLYRTTTNTTYRYIKRHKEAHMVSEPAEFFANLPSDDEGDRSPAASLLGAERRDQVRATLGRISAEKRMALVLFEMEGLTLREIAAMLKVPLQTVWSRVLNGRKDMARMLTKAYGAAS